MEIKDNPPIPNLLQFQSQGPAAASASLSCTLNQPCSVHHWNASPFYRSHWAPLLLSDLSPSLAQVFPKVSHLCCHWPSIHPKWLSMIFLLSIAELIMWLFLVALTTSMPTPPTPATTLFKNPSPKSSLPPEALCLWPPDSLHILSHLCILAHIFPLPHPLFNQHIHSSKRHPRGKETQGRPKSVSINVLELRCRLSPASSCTPAWPPPGSGNWGRLLSLPGFQP